MIAPTNKPSFQRNLITLGAVLLGAFLIVAAGLFFWSGLRSAAILSRADNPRLVQDELRLQRGTIWDRNGSPLAQSIRTDGVFERIYPQPSGGPSVGYYSLVHGTSGSENAFDDHLRGEAGADIGWSDLGRQTLHLPRVGGDLYLALDGDWQENASKLFGNRAGAVVLLEIPGDGSEQAWLRVLVSQPSYDPNLLDDQFETLSQAPNAPLLNRATQGQYQPGLLLQPFILAKALEEGIIELEDEVNEAARPVDVNQIMLGCISDPPRAATWIDVLRHGCPAPMLELGKQMGNEGLDSAFVDFGFYADPALEIETGTLPNDAPDDSLQAAIGQENLSVTPLQIGLALGALISDGRLLQPRVVEALSQVGQDKAMYEVEGEPSQAIPAEIARAIRQALSSHDDLLEMSRLVLSGPGGSQNGWYTGLRVGEGSDYVAVVVVESVTDNKIASRIGREILRLASES